MRFVEQFAHPYIIKPVDAEAGLDGDSVNMGKVHSICYKFAFGAVTGDAVLKFYVGATEGAKTTAVAFKYKLSAADQAAATSDQFAAAATDVASSGLTLTAATFDNRMVAIEFDSQAIPDATPWLTPELSAAASVLLVSCTAECETRASGNIPLTVIK